MDKDVKTIVDGFLDYLKENGKIHLLPEIAALLKKQADQEEFKGEVISASPLEASQIELLESLLKKKLGRKVKIVNIIDKSVIGGLIIRYRDLVIDQSVKAELKEIQKEIYGY